MVKGEAMGPMAMLAWHCLAATPWKQQSGGAALVPAHESHPHAAADPLAISMLAASQNLRHTALQRRNALRRAMACYDADSFKDSKGVTCEGWASMSCNELPVSCAYDAADFEAVRKACPVQCGECSVITAGGDPVLKHNGRFVKFSLTPNRLTTLVSWLAKNGDRLSILGATLSHPTRTDNQWFNEIQLMVNATTVLRLSVEQPDVMMKAELDGNQIAFPVKCTWKELVKGKCLDDNTDGQSQLKEFGSIAGHLSFTWSELKEQKVGDRKAKKILALFGAHASPLPPATLDLRLPTPQATLDLLTGPLSTFRAARLGAHFCQSLQVRVQGRAKCLCPLQRETDGRGSKARASQPHRNTYPSRP